MYILSSQIRVLFVGRPFAKSWSSTTRLSRHGHDSTWIPGFLFLPSQVSSCILSSHWHGRPVMGERFPSNPMPGLRLSGGTRPGRMSMLRLVTETVLPRASRSSRSSSASPSSSARSRFTVLGCLLHSWPVKFVQPLESSKLMSQSTK